MVKPHHSPLLLLKYIDAFRVIAKNTSIRHNHLQADVLPNFIYFNLFVVHFKVYFLYVSKISEPTILCSDRNAVCKCQQINLNFSDVRNDKSDLLKSMRNSTYILKVKLIKFTLGCQRTQM